MLVGDGMILSGLWIVREDVVGKVLGVWTDETYWELAVLSCHALDGVWGGLYCFSGLSLTSRAGEGERLSICKMK